MKKIIYLAIVLWLVAAWLFASVFAGCTAQPSPFEYVTPAATNDGWATASLKDVGLDSALLTTFIDKNLARRRGHGIHSMLIARQGKLVLESYFEGRSAAEAHDLRSATKSITALLVGAAVDRGMLSGPQVPIAHHLPAYQDLLQGAKQQLQLHHLLTMASGLACDDQNSRSPAQEDRIYRRGGDWIRHFLAVPMEAPAGARPQYCTIGVVTAGAVVAHAAGRPLDVFANEVLFEPLQISGAQWERFNGGKSVDAGGHLRLRSRDFAKIGQLVLDSGQWKGQQVISRQWIAQMTNPQVKLRGTDYGYLWWQHELGSPFSGRIYRVLAANGNGGQYLFVVPELGLLVAFTGGNYNSEKMMAPFQILTQVIFRAAGA